jgi:hypothetical protein
MREGCIGTGFSGNAGKGGDAAQKEDGQGIDRTNAIILKDYISYERGG